MQELLDHIARIQDKLGVLQKQFLQIQRENERLLQQHQSYVEKDRLQQHRLEELQQQLDNSIKALPPQCQLVFKLSRQDGLSNKEIAKSLNLSENTVKSHLKKADKEIKGNMEFLTALLLIYTFFQK